MIIDVFELVDVAYSWRVKKSVDRRDMGEERQQTNLTVLLHDPKELDHDFGNGAHKNLAFPRWRCT